MTYSITHNSFSNEAHHIKQTGASASATALDKDLCARGIGETALLAGWKRAAKKWVYPAIDPFTGIKRGRTKTHPTNKGEPRKYTWEGIGTNIPTPTYYAPQGFERLYSACTKTKALWIANGEPAVLSFLAAGVDNVLAWFGEGAVPSNLVERVRTLGVKSVWYVTDNDEAGHNAAKKVKEALGKLDNLRFRPLDLTELVPHKGDANDLWQALSFDASAFMQALMSAPELSITLEKEEAKPRSHSKVTGGEGREALKRDVEAHIRASAHKVKETARDYLKHCSLLRADRNPSGNFNLRNGQYNDYGNQDFGGRVVDLEEYARALGFNVDAYLKPLAKPAPTAKPIDLARLPDYNVSPIGESSPQEPALTVAGEGADLAGEGATEAPQGAIPQWWLNDALHGKWLAVFASFDADLPRIADALIQAVQAGAIGSEPFTANMLAKATGLLHKQVTKALPYLERTCLTFCHSEKDATKKNQGDKKLNTYQLAHPDLLDLLRLLEVKREGENDAGYLPKVSNAYRDYVGLSDEEVQDFDLAAEKCNALLDPAKIAETKAAIRAEIARLALARPESHPRLFVPLRDAEGNPAPLSPKAYREARLERFLSMNGEGRRVSYSRLAESFNVDRRTIIRLVGNLKDKGRLLVERQTEYEEVLRPSKGTLELAINEGKRKHSGQAFHAVAVMPDGKRRHYDLTSPQGLQALIDACEQSDKVTVSISPANRYTVTEAPRNEAQAPKNAPKKRERNATSATSATSATKPLLNRQYLKDATLGVLFGSERKQRETFERYACFVDDLESLHRLERILGLRQ